MDDLSTYFHKCENVAQPIYAIRVLNGSADITEKREAAFFLCLTGAKTRTMNTSTVI